MREPLREPAHGDPVDQWMLDGTWNAYQDQLILEKHEDCLVINNAIDTPPNDRLALGLAAIEAARTDAMKGGSLPEAVGGIKHDAHGWMGMNVVRKNLPSRRAWVWQFPLRQPRLVWNSDDELVLQVKTAIKDSLTQGSLLESKRDTSQGGGWSRCPNTNGGSQNGSSAGESPTNGAATDDRFDTDLKLRRIHVVLPLAHAQLENLADQVRKQLEAEGVWRKYPLTTLFFGAGNFPDRPNEDAADRLQGKSPLPVRIRRSVVNIVCLPIIAVKDLTIHALFGDFPNARQLHATVATLYALDKRIERIDEILFAETNGNYQKTETGFGTWAYSNPPGAGKSNGSDGSNGSRDAGDQQEQDPHAEDTGQNHSAGSSFRDESAGDRSAEGAPY